MCRFQLFQFQSRLLNKVDSSTIYNSTALPDSEPHDLADELLPGLPLGAQLERGAAALRRPRVLLRMVERQQHPRVLEDVERARPQVLRQTHLQADAARRVLGHACSGRHIDLF